MGKYLRVLSVLCPVILFIGGVLEAQQKADVIVDAMVMRVGRGTSDQKPTAMTSTDAARLLSALMNDATTELIDRSELRVSDGKTSMLKIGKRIPYAAWNDQPRDGAPCASPLILMQPKYIGNGADFKITPHVHSAEELSLHIAVSQHANLACLAQSRNEFDVRLHDRELTLLGGLSSLFDARSQWVIAVIPKIVLAPEMAR
jgi:hypothetical protein